MREIQKKNILTLSPTDARAFLLKEGSYFSFDLPFYFSFGNLLSALSQELSGKLLSNYHKQIQGNGSLKPKDFENVNYELMYNKNGKYAWRSLHLIHPAIYVALVHCITSDSNWEIIKARFNKNQCVECMSIPVVSQGEESDRAEQVTHWWDEIEQRSVALALEYEYVFHTDISDCYGSIYTHSIAWALHTKPTAKQNRGQNGLCGNVIDSHLKSMSYGQTNGIPQGSVLMDLIAEMVLSYADELLAGKFEERDADVKILRYRDDYRIFTNNPQTGERIIKYLTEVLADLGMQLNSQKTLCSNDVVRDSIKPDKFFSVVKSKVSEDIQQELLNIKHLAELFPNSGSMNKRLERLHEKILKKETLKYCPDVLISIVADLAISSPKTYPITSAILSKMISFVESEQSQKDLIAKIKNKFKRIPNTEHMDLWLQRITLKLFSDSTYEGRLCKYAAGDGAISIWNSDWLDGKLATIMSEANIVDAEKIEKMDSVIQPEEVRLFKQTGYY